MSSTQQPVYKIVLTGGPCAGKTTALARLSGFLSERGFRVFTVPEMATVLFVNGASVGDFGKSGAVSAFQRAIIDSQLAVEDAFARVAASTGSPSVLLCDRGVLDGSAYMSRDSWEELLRAKAPALLPGNDETLKTPEALERKLCERYDAVFHLVTAADGAERFYSLQNNAARTEEPEAAREQDAKTQRVWTPHPKHLVFDNSAASRGFEGKLQRVVEAAAKLVGLPVLPKGTRKFLVTDLPADDVFREHGVTLTAFYVTKTFLKTSFTTATTQGTSDDESAASAVAAPLHTTSKADEVYDHSYVRLRRHQDGSTSYGHVTVHVDPLEVLEKKRRCTPREYYAHLSNADPHRVPVRQRRLHFLHNHQSFVIHHYLDRDLAICHCQAARSDGSVEFPPFLRIGDEVTDNPLYSAFFLSQKKGGDGSNGTGASSSPRRLRRGASAALSNNIPT